MTYNLRTYFKKNVSGVDYIALLLSCIFISSNFSISFCQNIPKGLVRRNCGGQLIVSISSKQVNTFSINNYTTRLQLEGYLYAQLDSSLNIGDTLFHYFNLGPKYRNKHLQIKGVTNQNKSYKKHRDENLSFKDLRKKQIQIVKQAENNGYPFAQIRLDSILVTDSTVFADLILDPGPLFSFDSITLHGDVKIKPSFLSRFLAIKPDEPFSQRKVENAAIYLKELAFLQTSKPDLIFAEEKAKMILPLKARKANQADGVLGLMNNANGNGRVLITGELNINLNNLLQTGKRLHLHYRRFNINAQTVEFNYYHPVLIGPIDSKLDFSLLRQDTSFLNVSRQISLFVRSAGTTLGIFSGLMTSRRLSSTISPQSLSFDNYIYGFTYEWKNLNDFFMPRKGQKIFGRFSAGNKTVLEEIPPQSNFRINNSQFSFDFKIENYVTKKRATVFSSLALGKIYNNTNTYFLGDYYRFGGLKSLRGFNENNFFSSSYIISNLEYRIYTEESSYIFLFYDQGVLDNRSKIDYPLGFGPGISFKSNFGIFNFVFAMGRSNDQNLSLNLAKFHFGYFSQF